MVKTLPYNAGKVGAHMLWNPYVTATESVCHNEDPMCHS